MKIKTNKGIKEIDDIFPTLETFKNYVLKLDKNIRYDNEIIKKEIESLMFKLKEQEGMISLSLMRGWLVKNYSFNTKKWGDLEYWIERGWSKENAIEELKKRNNEIKQRNRLCIGYWMNKGFSKNEAIEQISIQQQKSAECVKNRHGKSKQMLIKKGYSEEYINRICLTPSNIQFWVNKGFSEDEAKEFVTKNQSNATKHVNYEKRLIPNNLGYWINKGFSEEDSKQKVSEYQSTFSLNKCIQKYGKVEGEKRFTERQNKWLNSLLTNGNMVIGYSKISQELFYKILETYDIMDREKIYFATHNGEYRIEKENGGVWLYDFTDLQNKKIIEYNGDDYHGNPNKYNAYDNPNPFRKKITAQEMWDKDKKKLLQANEQGFEILVIWDSEYRWGNKQEIIHKCLEFLGKK